MADAGIRTYCLLAREVEALNAEKKDRTEQMRRNKKSAHDVLKELMETSAGATVGDAGVSSVGSESKHYLVDLEGSTYRIESKPSKQPARTLSSGVCDLVEKLWDTQAGDISAVFSSPVDDPVAALVTYIENAVLYHSGGSATAEAASAPPPRRPSSVVVTPFRARGGVEEPEHAPEEWKALIRTVVEATDAITAVTKEHKDKKAELDKLKKTAEESLISDLDELPAGSIQRVSMKDRDGTTDTFYVRVKPSRRPVKRRISCAFFRKSLRSCLAQALAELRSDQSVADADVGYSVSSALRDALETKELTGRGTESPPRRISLDKMRVKSATAASVAQ